MTTPRPVPNVTLMVISLRFADLRRYLQVSDMGTWQVGGEPRLMGQLLLHDRESGIRLRVLKERRRAYPGGVPVAGHNSARRSYWAQPPLFGADPVAEPELIEMLALWDLKNSQRVEDGFTLRVVHTIEAGQYGQAVACDLSLEIVTGGSLFTSLRFKGDDDPFDFFVIDVDEADGGQGS